MSQFTVYRNANAKTRTDYPYLVDVQSDLLEQLGTRVVIPLTKAMAIRKKPIKDLTPVLEIDGGKYLLVTPQLAGIPKTALGPPIGSVNQYRNEIVAALDFLITGI